MSAEQRQLFDSAPEPWEADDQSVQLVASVVISAGGAKEFDYLVPDELRQTLEVGRRVNVPLGRGNRLVVGYCVRIEDRPAGRRRLKPVDSVLDQRGLLSPAMLRLTRWIADHYLCDWATVLDAVVPAGVRGGAGTRLTTLLSVDHEAIKRQPELKLSEKQQEVLKELAQSTEPMTPGELARAARCTQGPITTLRRKGLIRARSGRISTMRPEPTPPAKEKHLLLNPDQERALRTILDAMNARRHRTVLVHGVTGSGKTEVYIQAIQDVIAFRGRQAIVLVPEISLTPQTLERFRAPFRARSGRVAQPPERRRSVTGIGSESPRRERVGGRRRDGARFSPQRRNLGLIVLDEEHESSFKQDQRLRGITRATWRSPGPRPKLGSRLVLGSATPSLESWHRAQERLVSTLVADAAARVGSAAAASAVGTCRFAR